MKLSIILFFTYQYHGHYSLPKSSEILWSFFAEIVNGFNYFRKKAAS